ncbi:MIP family Ig-specific serine endopeptidase [Ureaplasma diversum]|uniref:DUF31 domain-containing protein n=1 Tax=Ureaplasma diversum NCTC 246 TaxID=1188241 RepID=A0A084F0Q9_9BACT|nr:hypothetical protein [Ureaplasma diversum]KEZ23801.1 Hypothetical protein, predicted lipoprotein, DUF31 family [Ureaplasma diversum NCTC 246]
MKKWWNKFKKLLIPTTLSLGVVALVSASCFNPNPKQNNQASFQFNINKLSNNKANIIVNAKDLNLSNSNNVIKALVTNTVSNAFKQIDIKQTNNQSFSLDLNNLEANTSYQINQIKINDQVFNTSFSFKTLNHLNLLKSISHNYENKQINTTIELINDSYKTKYDTLVVRYTTNDQLEQTYHQLVNLNNVNNKIKISFKPFITNRNFKLTTLALTNQSDLKDESKWSLINLDQYKLNSVKVDPSITSVKNYRYDFSNDQLSINLKSDDLGFTNNQEVVLVLDNNQTLSSTLKVDNNGLVAFNVSLKDLKNQINFKVLKINLKTKPANLIQNINNSSDNTIYDYLKSDFEIKGSRTNPSSYLKDLNLESINSNKDLVFKTSLSNLVNSSDETLVVLEFETENKTRLFTNPTVVKPTYKDELVDAKFTLSLNNTKASSLTFKKAWKLNGLNNERVAFSTNPNSKLTDKVFSLDDLIKNVNLSLDQLEFYEPQNTSINFKVPLNISNLLNIDSYLASIKLVNENNQVISFNNINLSTINNQTFIKTTLTNLVKNSVYKLQSIDLISKLNQSSTNLYNKDQNNNLNEKQTSFKTLNLDNDQKVEYNKAYLTKAVEHDTRVDNPKYHVYPKTNDKLNKYYQYFIPNNEVYQQAYDMTVGLNYQAVGEKGQVSAAQGTGWILDYIQPNDKDSYPTTFFIATNMHVAARFNYLEKEVLEGAKIPDSSYINHRTNPKTGLYLVYNPYLANGQRNNNAPYDQNLNRSLIATKIKEFAIVYTATNFLDKNFLANYRYTSTNPTNPSNLPDHAKDFVVLKVVFNDERAARIITRDFYYKYKNKRHKFAKYSLLTNSIDQLVNRSDFYIFGYAGGIPTINKPTTTKDFNNGAKLLINQAFGNYFLNKYNQIIPGIVNGSITNNFLNFKNQTGFVDDYQYFNIMYSFKDSALTSGSSGSVVLNGNKEIIGIHFAMVRPLDGSLAEPLIFEGFRINDQLILPAYDLINGGAPHQVYSYKQAFRKHFKDAKSWLFDEDPEWIDQVVKKEPIDINKIEPKSAFIVNRLVYANRSPVANR